jgi:hypothetical protein
MVTCTAVRSEAVNFDLKAASRPASWARLAWLGIQETSLSGTAVSDLLPWHIVMRHAQPSVIVIPHPGPCGVRCRDLCLFYNKMLLAATKKRKDIFANFQEQVIPQRNAESWQIYRYGPITAHSILHVSCTQCMFKHQHAACYTTVAHATTSPMIC